jgi:hypothetical protein
MRSVEEIKAELAEAQAVADAEKKALRDAVKPIWQYTITPEKSRDSFDRIWDETIVAYKLSGEVINKDEYLAAGNSELSIHSGGMRYLFNTGTGKLIGATGGGTIFISGGFGRKNDEAEAMVVHRINMFLGENPQGGDISQIVTEFRESTRA